MTNFSIANALPMPHTKQEIFKIWVNEHADVLYYYALRHGFDDHNGKDIVQETFLSAWRGMDSFREDASVRSWLFTIAGNLLRDDVRKRKGRRMLSLEERDLPSHADPFEELAAADAERRVRDGLARLPRLQREVFLLRVQQGSEYAEIAAALGTTPGAARVHYHHAVKRLKELVR